MQRYGIVLSDGGNIALTAEDDLYTTRNWSELNIGSRVFGQSVPGPPVRVQEFSVLDTGDRIIETCDCVRNVEPALVIPKNLAARFSQRRRAAKQIHLNWQDGTAKVDIYRDGIFRASADNVGSYSEKPGSNLRPSYRVCNFDTNNFTNAVVALPDRCIKPPRPRSQQACAFQANIGVDST